MEVETIESAFAEEFTEDIEDDSLDFLSYNIHNSISEIIL